MKQTALFIGHSKIVYEDNFIREVDESIIQLINKGYHSFLCGGYGDFDFLCAKRLYEIKKDYQNIESIWVHPYPVQDVQCPILKYVDSTLYPAIEGCPPRLAILKRNQWMVEQAQAAICYVQHDWGGAAKTLQWAYKKHLQIFNLAQTNQKE